MINENFQYLKRKRTMDLLRASLRGIFS